MSKYIQPSINLQSFHCPNCGVFSQHTWSNEIYCIYIQDRADGDENVLLIILTIMRLQNVFIVVTFRFGKVR